MQDKVKLLFEYFYSKIYRSNYNVDVTSKYVIGFERELNKFISSEIIGLNFLIEYFAFGFYYYVEKKTIRNVELNWIIGNKMIKRFFEREDGWDYYTSQFLREYNINIDELKFKLNQVDEEKQKNYLKVYPSEELEKSRIPDTEARVYSCLNTTTLFNHRSVVCVMCHQKVFCRQLLKKVNPSLYNNRGYANKS